MVVALLAPRRLILAGAPQESSTRPLEEALARGIQLVEQGDYDRAIVILDEVVSRLSRLQEQKARVARAHLYLGIAYVGEGQEALALASLREALRLDPNMTLSAAEFSPKLRELFQRVKNDSTRDARPAASAPPKRPRSKLPLILLGVGAGGAAVAVAAGGGSAGPSAGASPSPSPAASGLSGPQDIVLIASSPAPGATVSLSQSGTLIRMTVSAVHDQSGAFGVFAGFFLNGRPTACVGGASAQLRFTGGQALTNVPIDLIYVPGGSQPSDCPPVPFTVTQVVLSLFDSSTNPGPTLFSRNSAVTFTFVR